MTQEQSLRYGILTAGAGIGGAVSAAFGGFDGVLICLGAFMAIDYCTGLALALVWKKSPKTENGAAESQAAFKGLIRKVSEIFAVLIGARLDAVAGTVLFRDMIALFFIGSEGLSVLENFGLMGVPYPAFLKNALEALKKRGNSGGEQK